MLGESLHITSEYLTQEAKVVSAMSRLEALEVELKVEKRLDYRHGRGQHCEGED